MNHCFILTAKENVEVALDYYSNPTNCKKLFADCICFVSDRFILHYYEDLFMDIEIFIQSFNKTGNKLDYHGKTIISPNAASVIKSRFESNLSFTIKTKFNIKIGCFYKLLCAATNNKLYIVHLGI